MPIQLHPYIHVDGLVEDSDNTSGVAMELQ